MAAFRKGITLQEYMADLPVAIDPVEIDGISTEPPRPAFGAQSLRFEQIDEEADEEEVTTPSFGDKAHNRSNLPPKSDRLSPHISPQQPSMPREPQIQANLKNIRLNRLTKGTQSLPKEVSQAYKFPKPGQQDLLKTMYGRKETRVIGANRPVQLSSTLSHGFWPVQRSISVSRKADDVISEVEKYERALISKYDHKLDVLAMRIQGIRGRLCERPLQK